MNNLLSNFQFKKNQIALVLLFSIFSSQHAFSKGSAYEELLDNCAKEIYSRGYDAEKVTLKLKKKFEKAGGYRFWINIIDNGSKEQTKAYCFGKKRSGIVTELEIFGLNPL